LHTASFFPLYPHPRVGPFQVNPRLTRLDLQDNDIGDAGCAVLAHALRAHACAATCASGHATSLTRLSLHHNRISSDGAAFLAHALYFNSTLAHLELEHNAIGSAGAAAMADALMVNHGCVRTSLSLSSLLRSCCLESVWFFQVWIFVEIFLN
jgi:hypothetical protein